MIIFKTITSICVLMITACTCVGAIVIWRHLYAKLNGTQTVRVRATVPSVKRDVDDMVLNDMIVGEPEGQVGEY